MHTDSALQLSRDLDLSKRCEFSCKQVLEQIVTQIVENTDVRSHNSIKTTSYDGKSVFKSSSRNKRVSAPKRMANPFSNDLTPVVQEDDINWTKLFSHPHHPLHIDVGCAKGRCIERLAARDERRNWNHLGLEIRSSVLSPAISRLHNSSNESDAKNLHFLVCNFAASAKQILQSLPIGSLQLVSFQFPDPWRRSKHKKRLIVQPQLILLLATYMTPGAAVYISSDCKAIADRMMEQFLASPSQPKTDYKLKEVQKDGVETHEDVDNDCDEGDGSDDEGDDVGYSHKENGDSKIDDHSSNNVSSNLLPLSTSSSTGKYFELLSESTIRSHIHQSAHHLPHDKYPSSTSPSLAINGFLLRNDIPSSLPISTNASMQQPTKVGDEINEHQDSWLSFNPLDEPSERELVCEVDWRPVYRFILMRTSVCVDNLST